MYMMFIDESGSPPLPGKINGERFVLGSVILNGDQWHQISDDLNRIKKSYTIHGEIKWRHFSPRNISQTNSIAHLSMIQRDEFRNDLFSLITKYKSIRLIAIVVDPGSAYKKAGVEVKSDLYHLAYRQVTERFQYFLQDISRSTGSRASGIVVCDHRQSADDMALRELHEQLLKGDGQSKSKYQNLVEGLFLAPSHMSTGIQLADLVAGAVFRKFEKGDSRFFDKIEPAFRRSSKGSIDGFGLVHWPKDEDAESEDSDSA